jgi:2-oxoglutarate/2-oxoacid ferredoxin oxidoreductase subunit alpha
MSQKPIGPIVNDFSMTFSTINGSGSATANTTLLRAIFRMGIPVSGKNIFPSNISGQPTWYTLRVSKDGFVARVERDDIIVAMNPATFNREVEYLAPGGVLFYADDIKMPINRDDIISYPMAVKRLVKEQETSPKLRDYLANMVYVGVLAKMLGIEIDKIQMAIDFHFSGKKVAVESNMSIVQAAYKWAGENLEKRDTYHIEPMNLTDGMIMTDGNVAGALGSIYGGVQFAAWYPITPASSLAEALHEYVPLLREDPVEEGKETCVVVQAEDELAAIGMAVGAGWGGLRAMTSTSGPGLSLMAEYLGLAYYSETPVVLWDVQRVGPSTGLPTRTAQGDLTQAYFHSHGDKNFILLFPASMKECFEIGWKSFDIAERAQSPVIVMSDLDLGMNQWISEPFEYPDTPMDRGKILWDKELDEFIKKHGSWGRYLDVDGDGIPYRTVPGNRNPLSAYFARGTGHDEMARYSEEPDVWERGLDRLAKKYITIKKFLPLPVIQKMDRAEIGLISFGSSDPAVQEARHYLTQMGIPTDYLRVRSIPFHEEVVEFIRCHPHTYVIEANRDGQMKQLLTLEAPDLATHLRKVAHTDGLPLTARWINEQILIQEGK